MIKFTLFSVVVILMIPSTISQSIAPAAAPENLQKASKALCDLFSEQSKYIAFFNTHSSVTPRDIVSGILAESQTMHNVLVIPSNRPPLRMFRESSRRLDLLIFFTTTRLPKDTVPAFIRQLIWLPSVNYGTKIIVVLSDTSEVDTYETQRLILNQLKSQKFYNAVTINVDQKKNSSTRFLSFYPYPAPLQPAFRTIDAPLNLSSLFEDKTKNFNRKRLTIFQANEYPFTRVFRDGLIVGVNRYLFHIIAQQLNASVLVLAYSRPFTAFSPLQIDSLGADICLHTSEVSSTASSRTLEQFTYPFLREMTHLIVLQAEPTLFGLMVAMWNKSALLFLFLVTVVQLLCWKTGKKCDLTDLEVVRIVFLSSPPSYLRCSRRNYFLVNLSFFCLIYMTFVRSKIVSVLASPYQQIDSVQQFIDNDYRVYLPDNTEFPMIEYQDRIVRYGEEEQLNFTISGQFLERHPNVGLLMWSTKYRAQKRIHSRTHMIPQVVRQAMVSQKTMVNAPLYDFLNDLSFRIFESGLRQYMLINAAATATMAARAEIDSSHAQSLTLVRLRFAWELWSIGCAVASLILLLELLWARRRSVLRILRSLAMMRRETR